MNATVTYKVANVPHPFSDRDRNAGLRAWCLVKITTPAFGPVSEEPVAIFNWDTEAMVFQGHVHAAGLDGQLVALEPDARELFRNRGPR